MNKSKCYLICLVFSLFIIIIYLLRLPGPPLMPEDGTSQQSSPDRKIPYEKAREFKTFFFADKPHVIFAHVPKTSGTSLRAVVQEMSKVNGWKDRSFYGSDEDGSFEDGSKLPKVLYGHRVSALLGKLEGKNYTFAMLRKPFNRVISGYKHHLLMLLPGRNRISRLQPSLLRRITCDTAIVIGPFYLVQNGLINMRMFHPSG